MTGPDFKDLIARCGLSHRQAAVLIGVNPATVSVWCGLDEVSSEPAVRMLTLMAQCRLDPKTVALVLGVELPPRRGAPDKPLQVRQLKKAVRKRKAPNKKAGPR